MKVVLIAASTICGRISPAIMGSAHDRRRLENARVNTGASLIGAGTFRKDNPEMRGPGGVILEDRLRGVVSLSGNISLEGHKIFDEGPKPIIFTSEGQAGNLKKKLGKYAEVVDVPVASGGILISSVIYELDRRGVESVLIEGGSMVNYSSFKEGVIDEVLLTITPFLSGDSDAVSLAEGLGPIGNPFLALDLIECETVDSGEIFCRYRVEK